MSDIDNVLAVAAREIGVGEDPPGSNRGPCEKYGNIPGKPWCAAWVCWVWHEATGTYPTSAGFRRGTGALWSAAGKDKTRVFIPTRGDIFYKGRWKNGKKIGGHVGFVGFVDLDGKTFETIEGNSNDCVARRTRDVSGVIGFIRPKE